MSTETTEPAKRRGRPPAVTSVAPRSDEGTWSPDDVLRKRLAGEPFGVRADQIPLKEPGRWQLYIASSEGQANRHYDMAYRKGWTPCTVEDLAPGITVDSIGYRLGPDGRTLVRGHKGEEVVYKMPKEIYDRLQMQKAEANKPKSERKNREEVANVAASEFGDEAADYLARHGAVTIRDTVG